jgi:hypothetical protein
MVFVLTSWHLRAVGLSQTPSSQHGDEQTLESMVDEESSARGFTWEEKEKWRADPLIPILPSSRSFVVRFHHQEMRDIPDLQLRLSSDDTLSDVKAKVRAIPFWATLRFLAWFQIHAERPEFEKCQLHILLSLDDPQIVTTGDVRPYHWVLSLEDRNAASMSDPGTLSWQSATNRFVAYKAYRSSLFAVLPPAQLVCLIGYGQVVGAYNDDLDVSRPYNAENQFILQISGKSN